MDRWQRWRWRIIGTLLLGLLLFWPGSAATPLDGLPLAPSEIVVAGIMLVIIWGLPWFSHRRLRIAWLSVLGVLIVWQVVGAVFFPFGWSLCLQRQLEADTLTTPCEGSAQFPDGERSFVVADLHLEGPGFPLYFMNEAAFHYRSEDDPERTTMPFGLVAETYYRPAADTELIVTTNTPETMLKVGDEEQMVPFDAELRVSLPAGVKTRVQLAFIAPNADSNAVQVKSEAHPFWQERSLLPGTVGVFMYRLVFWLALSVLVGVAALSVGIALWQLDPQLRAGVWLGAMLLVAVWLTREKAAGVVATAALVMTGYHVVGGSLRKLVPFMLVGLFLLSFVYVSDVVPPDEMQFLPGGGDQLTHESYSRAVLKANGFRSYLEAGEPALFYFQPGYRYVTGFVHQVLGEPLWAPALVQTFLLMVVVWYGMHVTYLVGKAVSVGLFGMLMYFAMAVPEDTPLLLTQTLLQEGLGVPLFLLAMLATVHWWYERRFSLSSHFLLGLLWGFTVSIRTNLLPALAAVGVYWLAVVFMQKTWRNRLWQTVALIGGGVVFPLLIVLRNLVVAGKLAFLPTSLHPNLIDPFRPLFPNIGGASDLTLGAALSTILATYDGRRRELLEILWTNLLTHYVGNEPLAVAAWIVFLAGVTLVLVRGSWQARVLMVMLLIFAGLPALFGSLFLHRSIAVHSQTHLVVFTALTFVTGLLPSLFRLKKRGV